MIHIQSKIKTCCLITYCSRQKNEAPGLMPAIERYASPRIRMVHEAAVQEEKEFRILSGKFGLLSALDPIPWYDHLLQPKEVADIIDKIAAGIGQYQEVVFVYCQGDYIVSYLDAVKTAADRTSTLFSLRELDHP